MIQSGKLFIPMPVFLNFDENLFSPCLLWKFKKKIQLGWSLQGCVFEINND